MSRGRKSLHTDNWYRPGGPLPSKGPGLSKQENAHYKAFLAALDAVGMAGKADLQMVLLAARLAARADRFRAVEAGLPDVTVRNSAGALTMHPVYAELSRTESRLRDTLAALYLTPRARGSTKLSADQRAQASAPPMSEDEERLLGILDPPNGSWQVYN